MEAGLFKVKERAIDNPDGTILLTRTTKVTGLGQVFFLNCFWMVKTWRDTVRDKSFREALQRFPEMSVSGDAADAGDLTE
jgi:hypothetical protein